MKEKALGGKLRPVLLLLTVILVGIYYHWSSRLAGNRFTPDRDLPGYYNYLGRAFAAGQLHLPLEPSRELLALPDPWDPTQNNGLRLHDAVLYNGRFYVYHGGAPALFLFAPWRLITGSDLPQYFGLFLIVFTGFLFWCGAVVRVRGPDRTTPLMLLAIALCSPVPFLLNRIEVYEIAIGGGFLCVGGGMFFLAGRQYIASGLLFGLAVGCRPHLALAGLGALIYIARTERSGRALARFGGALLSCFALAAAYNFARFGNPFEFGVRYLMAGDRSQQHIIWSVSNLVPGLFYYLWSPPELGAVFPWFRNTLQFPGPNYPFPKNYFLEPITGILFSAPLAITALRARTALGRFSVLMAGALLLYLLGTGLTTERYILDFLPLLLFAAVVESDWLPRPVFASLVAYGCLVNMAFGIAGPYDDYLRNRTDSYLRLARILSPLPHHRPQDCPPLQVTLRGKTEPMPDGIRQPLLSIGREVFRYTLFQEHKGGLVRFVSQTDQSTVVAGEGLPETTAHTVSFRYHPTTHVMALQVDDLAPVEHTIERLITAPSQIRKGESLAYRFLTVPRFVGTLEVTAGQIP